jgi:5-methyltetrahydrofolate--homocysteine methyltransferase
MNPRAALDALETIQYCKEKGFATICGISNISYGMPGRSAINAAFLKLAREKGLNLAIANPAQDLDETNDLAFDLLLDKEDAAIEYIEYTRGR